MLVAMTICFGHTTALELWRYVRPSQQFRVRPSRAHVPNIADTTAALAFLENFKKANITLEPPAQLLVSTANGRRRPRGIIAKTAIKNTPLMNVQSAFGSFLLVTPGELFIECAQTEPLEKLIEIGFELCGSYALSPCEAGFVQARPITSVEELRRYTEKALGRNGRSNARKALRFIANGSASPAETRLAMLLCLPRMRGGYGLPLPRMNHRIHVTGDAQKITSNKFFVCNLYWSQAQLDVEYDSDAFHASPVGIASDAERRNALEYMGISVVTITNSQTRDIDLFDNAARIIARSLGVRLAAATYNWFTRRKNLRRKLVP